MDIAHTLQIGLMLLTFVGMTLLMFYRLLPALLALPRTSAATPVASRAG